MKAWKQWRIPAGMLMTILCLGIIGCGSGESRKEITEIRETSAVSQGAAVGISTAERLGLSQAQAHPPGTGAMGMMGMAGSEAAAAFGWTAPEGWERAPDRPMRLATYLAQDGAEEGGVSLLTGMAGADGPAPDQR